MGDGSGASTGEQTSSTGILTQELREGLNEL